MQKSLTQKILDDHLVSIHGREMALHMDQTLTQDATGTLACLQFESLGLGRLGTELSVSYVDHNTVQIGPENADDHRYLKTIAAKYGLVFSPAGNGICHQVHLERFAVPGKTLLGSDSHTCTCGAMGMAAIGAGGLDVAVAMAGGPFYIPVPEIINIHLLGKLNDWVSAKDVVLTLLETFGTQGNVGRIFEYGGSGVRSLSVPERATLANMGAECGVTTSIFPSDDNTRAFLASQGRARDWVRLEADEGAAYQDVYELDLGRIVPKVACPHSPGNVQTVQALKGTHVHQVCIGSCTNSSYKDLKMAATILKGRRIHPRVSLVVAPGSRQVLQAMARESNLADFIASGARIQECACGFCVGNSQSPQSEGVSLRTSNRNFLGRSGTKSAQVYLCSPETAAASAITGVFTDPREMGIPYPSWTLPDRFELKDEMFIKPVENRAETPIFRGPHMGTLPLNSALPEALSAKVTLKLGDRVTTDHIVPAGDKLKLRSNVTAYARFVFQVVDESFAERAAAVRDAGIHNVVIAGFSYGQGSSREHAALCPMVLGVRIIVAKTFERIHKNNLINFGILPLTFVDQTDYDWIAQEDELELAGLHGALKEKRYIPIFDKTKGRSFETSCLLSEREMEIVIAGGKLPYLKKTNPENKS